MQGVLRFTVSSDEENVDVELVQGERCALMQASVHWYIAALLARARHQDETEALLPPRERGWMYRDELCAQLRTTPSKLNVDLHRLRAFLGRAGVEDAAELIERRSATGQLRLGTANIELL